VNEQLWGLYQVVCQDEVRPLEEFVRRLVAGEWGRYPKEDVLELLAEIEGMMLSNIQIKTMEGSRFAEAADEVSEQTQKEFEDLVALVEDAYTRQEGSGG
jgi:hypothetical protein